MTSIKSVGSPTVVLLTITLADLHRQQKHHQDKLTEIQKQIASHEAVIKMIEDAGKTT